MSKLLELEIRTYLGKEYRDYLKSQEDDEVQEGDEWKRDLGLDAKNVPRAYPSRILIDPSKFIAAIETSSLEELAEHPDNPGLDSVDLCLEDGLQLSIIGNLDVFKKKWTAFHKAKVENK